MAQKQTAVVVVSKEWVNTAVRLLINEGKSSRSSGETHMLIAPVEDASDDCGMWLSGITTTQLTDDGSPVTMKFMVPWSFVYAVGIIEDEHGQVKPGFVTDQGTLPFGKKVDG